MHHGRRHPGSDPNRGAQGEQQEPERLEEHVGCECAGQSQYKGEHAQHGACRGERDHHKVGGDSDQRELVEVGEG